MTFHNKIEEGAKNLRRIREYFATHPCATQAECCIALGLHPKTVCAHVKTIRAEWRKRPGPFRADATKPIAMRARAYDPLDREYDNEVLK